MYIYDSGLVSMEHITILQKCKNEYDLTRKLLKPICMEREGKRKGGEKDVLVFCYLILFFGYQIDVTKFLKRTLNLFRTLTLNLKKFPS